MPAIVDIKCTQRDTTLKADVLEYRQDRIRVAVHGSELAIDLRKQGDVYVGKQAGLEFVCTSSYQDIVEQMRPRH